MTDRASQMSQAEASAELWDRIRSVSQTRQLSERGLCRAAGVAHMRFMRLRTGKRPPREAEVAEIARALGMSAGALTAGLPRLETPALAWKVWSAAEEDQLRAAHEALVLSGADLSVAWLDAAAEEVGRTPAATAGRLFRLGLIERRVAIGLQFEARGKARTSDGGPPRAGGVRDDDVTLVAMSRRGPFEVHAHVSLRNDEGARVVAYRVVPVGESTESDHRLTARLVEVRTAVWQVATLEAHPALHGHGIGPAVLFHAQSALRGLVRSSSNHPKFRVLPDERRSVSSTAMWDRLRARRFATYDGPTDRYLLTTPIA